MMAALWQPQLSGTLLRLRPLNESDFVDLHSAASDPLIWEQHPDRERYKQENFQRYFQSAVDSKGALIIIDQATDKIIGSSRYTNHNPAESFVEVGYTFLARQYWGKGHNRELKTLMLNHAFQFVDNVFFYVGDKNLRSQAAVKKIGAVEVARVTQPAMRGGTVESIKYHISKTNWIGTV